MGLEALRVLDEIQHLSQLDAFDPSSFITGFGDGGAPGGDTLEAVGAQLDELRRVLDEIDRFVQKSMRIRLSGEPLPTQLRTLITATVCAYARDLALLRSRVGPAMARIDPSMTDRVMDTAERALAVRAALRDGVFEAARRVAAARLPAAQKAARDRSLGDELRQRWGQARVELEQMASQPERVEAGSFAERIAKIPPPPDEPEPESAANRFSLLEID